MRERKGKEGKGEREEGYFFFFFFFFHRFIELNRVKGFIYREGDGWMDGMEGGEGMGRKRMERKNAN